MKNFKDADYIITEGAAVYRIKADLPCPYIYIYI